MAVNKKIRDLKGRDNDPYFIKSQYIVPYSTSNNSRYKHIDELLLKDGKLIKHTLGPVDLSIYPYDGVDIYTVTEADENRIDIIATKLYGAAYLYWILCYINNIDDPLNVQTGRILLAPKISGLRQFPNPLS